MTIMTGVRVLEQPCWVVVLAGGKPLDDDQGFYGESHYLNEQEAREALPGYATEDRPESAFAVSQNEVPCTVAFAVCGEEFVYEGDAEEVHFDSPATVTTLMFEACLTEVRPGVFTCRDKNCDTCKAAVAAMPPPELPGQIDLPVLHDLKTWPEQFRAVVAGVKTFDIRRNDRGFRPGDRLRLREWDPVTGTYSGRSHVCGVGYIAAGEVFGLDLGDEHVIMSLVDPRQPR